MDSSHADYILHLHIGNMWKSWKTATKNELKERKWTKIYQEKTKNIVWRALFETNCVTIKGKGRAIRTPNYIWKQTLYFGCYIMKPFKNQRKMNEKPLE